MSDDNPAYTDRYVLRALRRIGESRFGPADYIMKGQELGEAVRAKMLISSSINTGPRPTPTLLPPSCWVKFEREK